MKSVKLFALTLAAVCLLTVPLTWGQGANPPASTKESGKTSGRGMTAVEQASKQSGETAEQQISTIQAQLIQAIVRSDTAFLEKCFADDYTVIHGNGTLSTKAKEIESFKSGATKYESIEVRETLKVRVYGDTAVVNELASIKATFNGKPYNGDVRNTRVWVKQKGDWRLVAFQATRVAP